MIPLEGHSQSTGRPGTYYKYSVETFDRTATSVHVRVWYSCRMEWYSSYYSFRIAHECRVNGVYQYADIKTTRKFWGHQWEGSYYDQDDMYWQYGEYDYDGTAWHGPYKVFDAVVPMGVDDTDIEIIPCVTQPPITGLGGVGIYAPNPQDVTNWAGQWGYWRPFGDDEMIGSYTPWNLGVPCPEDGPFLNNRWLDTLEGGSIGAYRRPQPPSGVSLTPAGVDVSEQRDRPLQGLWRAGNGASSYDVRLYLDGGAQGGVSLSRTASTKVEFTPMGPLSVTEMKNGDRVRIGVASVDSQGVQSASRAYSNWTTYSEVASSAPTNAWLAGRRRGERNEVFFRGETADLHYSGQKDGSWPIETYRLVRLSDGKSVSWDASQAARDPDALGGKVIALSAPGVDRAPRTERFELRAYDARGAATYMPSGGWFRFDVLYYGGLVWVYDSEWMEGPCWVWDGSTWRQADEVHVWDGSTWRRQ